VAAKEEAKEAPMQADLKKVMEKYVRSPSTSPSPGQQPAKVGQRRPSSEQTNPAGKAIACRFCEKTFSRAVSLKMHYDMTHQAEIKAEAKAEQSDGGASSSLSTRTDGVEVEVAINVDAGESSKAPKVKIKSFHAKMAKKSPQGRSLLRPGAASGLAKRSTTPAKPGAKSGLSPLATSVMSKQHIKSMFGAKPRPSLAGRPSAMSSSLHKNNYQKPNVSNSVAPARSSGGQAKMILAPEMPGFKRRARPGADSSSEEEEEEGRPKHGVIIRKRLDNDSDDEDFKTSAKSVPAAGPDGRRTSSRIRTRKVEKKEDEECEKSASEESCKESGVSGETEDSSSAAAANGASSSAYKGLPSKRKGKRGRRSAPALAVSAEPETPKEPLERTEECEVEGCDRKFYGYFQMMRHVAFKHRAERTRTLMKLKLKKAKEEEEESPQPATTADNGLDEKES